MPATDGGPVLKGVGVTRGIAIAEVHRTDGAKDISRVSGTPAEERIALEGAIASATRELDALIAAVDEEAGEILEFQLALLEDDDMQAPAWSRIDAGEAADAAWCAMMDAEAEDYLDPEDEVLSARAADLRDLRDRVLRALCGVTRGDDPPEGPRILVGADLAPSALLSLPPGDVAGIALGAGSATSHVALLARGRGVPMVTGLGDLSRADAGTQAILDASAGTLALAPAAAALARARDRATEHAETVARANATIARPVTAADGSALRVSVNVDHLSMLEVVEAGHCDGIGLARTELLFRDGAPSEAQQLEVYTRLLRWAGGRTVTVRTLDAGGDKPVPGITVDGETNPFLGLRGIRLSLARPAIFRTQLRALLRAAASGPLRVMIPMVTSPGEMDRVREIVDEVATELDAAGIVHARPALGMMVEVPAAALALEHFTCDFYSVGTNDLVQYATAAARDNAAVADLASDAHAGVTALLERIVEAGRRTGREVSVCGDMASRSAGAVALMRLGIRSLSVAPAALGEVKAALRAAGRDTAQ